MRALFIHPQFPGPFLHIAGEVAKNPRARVLFLTEYHHKSAAVPRVRKIALPAGRSDAESAKKTEPATDEDSGTKRAQIIMKDASRTANMLLRLHKEGFSPDFIYTAATGHSLYVRDIFPDALCVVYADWFHKKDLSFNFFHAGKERMAVDFAIPRVQNTFQSNALLDCHLAITSTPWQKAQYPPELANKITVMPPGVDTSFFSPAPATPLPFAPEVQEWVSFVMDEPAAFAGVPQFFACLPSLLQARPQCHVAVVCENARMQAMAEQALAFLAPEQRQRAHALRIASPAEKRLIFRASCAHAYLAPPFTMSHVLPECMSCGCLVVGSDTAPVRHLVQHGRNGLLVDFWDSDALARALTEACAKRAQSTVLHMRRKAREDMEQKFNLEQCTQKHLRHILDCLHAEK